MIFLSAPASLRALVLRALIAAGALGGLAFLPGNLRAVQAERPDSGALRDRARDAQWTFEWVRRRHLPVDFGNPGGAECDDRVGRLCWVHDDGSVWDPEPEAPEVGVARDTLLATLERIATDLPGDEWILGQRVAYLGEAGRWEEALELARACRGAPSWWCSALEGTALHRLGRYGDAEGAFQAALGGMEPDRAREWMDVRPLLDGDGREVIPRANTWRQAEEPARVAALWRLADPLYLVEGNDRRTEHFARRTLARIRSRGRNPHGISWGSDLEEFLIRYGPEVGWRRNAASGYVGTETVSGYHDPEGRSYVPPGRLLRDSSSASPGEWVPGLAYAPSAYAPRHAPVILPMEAAAHVFTRGETALIVAPFRLPEDTTRRAREGRRAPFEPLEAQEDEPLQAGLFLVSRSDGRSFSVWRDGAAEGDLMVEVPAGAYWASTEVWDPGEGRAGRVRHGVTVPSVPPDVLALSDLLRLEADVEPGSLEDAAGHILPWTDAAPGERIRIGWEVSGLGWREEVLGYRLTLGETSGGFFSRLGRWLGLGGEEARTALEWEEPGPDGPGPVFRSVFVELPQGHEGEEADLILRLELRTQGREVLKAERLLRIRDPARR